jgi:hypothetical protein
MVSTTPLENHFQPSPPILWGNGGIPSASLLPGVHFIGINNKTSPLPQSSSKTTNLETASALERSLRFRSPVGSTLKAGGPRVRYAHAQGRSLAR